MPPKRSKKELFNSKELVLAKMHGFPAWPSFVMPLDLVPEAILQAKKKTTNYCVIFIPDGDFYWMNEKSLEKLSQDALNKKLEKLPSKIPKKKAGGRTANVNEALLAAKDLQFDVFIKSLDLGKGDIDDEEYEEEDEENGADAEYEEEANGQDEDVDEDEDVEAEDGDNDKDNEDNEIEAYSGKTEDEDEAANADVDEYNNISKIKEEDDSSIILRRGRNLKRNKSGGSTASERSNKRRATKVEERPTTPVSPNRGKAEESPKPINKEEKQQQLWLCRIKLQRTLIQRNQPVTPSDPTQFPPPTPDELSVARIILHRLVDFPITVEYLKSTKIHKVLKCILRNKDLEYPDSFKLHEKCNELLDKWSDKLEELKLLKEKESNHTNSKQVALGVAGSPGADESEFSGVDTSLPLKNNELDKQNFIKTNGKKTHSEETAMPIITK